MANEKLSTKEIKNQVSTVIGVLYLYKHNLEECGIPLQAMTLGNVTPYICTMKQGKYKPLVDMIASYGYKYMPDFEYQSEYVFQYSNTNTCDTSYVIAKIDHLKNFLKFIDDGNDPYSLLN